MTVLLGHSGVYGVTTLYSGNAPVVYFRQGVYKIGTVLNIRLPVQYVYTTGQGLQLQDVTEILHCCHLK